MRKLVIIVSAFAATAACDRSPQPRRDSVTVALPPARPHTPKPGFSISAGTSGDAPATPIQVDG